MKENKIFNEDWKILTKFFPKGWRAKARELGVLKRKRNIKSTNILLRIFLIHLADGCSLRETVTRAKQGKAFTIFKDGQEFVMLNEFKSLDIGQIGSWTVVGKTKDGIELPLRICAIRKSQEEADKSIKKAIREAKKKQKKITNDTLELHKYIILATSLDQNIITRLILELYRFRWQIEIAFKRLKSIIGLGHLPKIDKDSCSSWLHGKIFVALLAQAIIDEGRYFSPWGFPI